MTQSNTISKAIKSSSKIDVLLKTEKMIRWMTPPDDWIKLNVDGASRQNPGMVGGGRVLINHTAKWVRGFAAHFGVCSSVQAELLVLLHGLKMAWACGVKKLLIHVDSA